MSLGKSGPLTVVGLLIWAIVLVSDGALPVREAWIPSAAFALCGLMLFLTRGNGDGQGRRPPPRWRKGLRPVPADCPEAVTHRVRRAVWVPPRLRY
jgi:hypothetical protein